jgi:hypothetical protein
LRFDSAGSHIERSEAHIEQSAKGNRPQTTDYRTTKKEKISRVLREPPFDRLRVVRELEPQDPEGNREAKASFDTLRMVSPVEPQREPSSEKIY